MSSSVEQIKSKIDIVSLVSSYIQLEKAGGNFKGKCPFHNEKSPSFFVSPDRGSYYCFGCHAKGDIFTFVQEFEGLDFVGALKMLAEKAGVTLDRFEREDKTEKDKILHALDLAVFFYQKKLSENVEAKKYIVSRGLTEETVMSFKIGYAPAEWRSLFDYLKSKGVSEGDMLRAGLIKRPEGTIEKYYDTFRGRIMFPISDSSGQVVGFSGRILVPDDKSPKYLNSPETEVFNKSEILFGLDKAKKDIRIKDYSVLVEGQMDLVMLHQAGISNTVASSGTALSAMHLTKLRRLSNRIIMAYDGDSAGFLATDRSGKLAISLGMELKIMSLPLGKDPADLAKENLPELVLRLSQSKHIIDFYTDSLLERKLETRELGKEIQTHVLPYVALLTSSIEKAHFIKTIAQKAFIKEDALWEDLKRVNVPETPQEVKKVLERVPRTDSMEKKIIGIIMWQKTLPVPSLDIEGIETKAREILLDRHDELMTLYEKDRDALLFETESYYNNTIHISTDVTELLLGLEEEYLKKQFATTMSELQKAEQSRDSSQILKLLEECQRISNKIHELKQKKK
jgi:DNA primase